MVPYASVLGDATDDAMLEQAGIRRARVLVAALSEDAGSVYVTGTYLTFGAKAAAGVLVIKLDKGPLLGGSVGGRTDLVAPSGTASLQPAQGIGRLDEQRLPTRA